jgi:hypothetical protein
MIVSNMRSSKGNDVPNQFTIDSVLGRTFQSYKSTIAFIDPKGKVTLDSYYWNYSRTTSKYLSMFLNSSTLETKKNIKEGIYKLANLN